MRTFPCILLISLLLMATSAIPSHATDISGSADFTPWSSYWWPSASGELVFGYAGEPSPFNKYDLYVTGVSNGALTSWGRENESIYAEDADTWWGLCHAWANAAVLEDIDFEPSVEDGIFFAVGDKKGLVTAMHISDPVIQGISNENPLIFHNFLTEYIGEQKIGFVADLDSSEEVWSYPIYKYKGTIVTGSTYDDVQVTIYYANDLAIDPDYQGTDARSHTYYYRLYKSNGAYTSGVWRSGSLYTHPDRCWIPLEASVPAVMDYDTVEKIAASSSQPYSPGDTLPPGHHVLLLSTTNTSTFTIDAGDGATMRLFLSLDRQRQNGLDARYVLSSGTTKINESGLDSKLRQADIDGPVSGLLTLQFTPTLSVSSNEPIIAHVYLDMNFANTIYLPGYQSGAWKGLALANADETAGENLVYATILDETGMPRSSYGPGTLQDAAHWAGVIDAVPPVDTVVDGDPSCMKITSEKPVSALLMTGGYDNSLFNPPVDTETSGVTQWCVPILVKNSGNAMVYTTNTGDSTIETSLQCYTNDGTWSKAVDVTLDSLATSTLKSLTDIKVDGYALVADPESQLRGSLQYRKGAGLNAELPFLAGGTSWQVLHPAATGGWTTELVLINMTDAATTVDMQLRIPSKGSSRSSLQLAAHQRLSMTLTGDTWGVSDDVLDASAIDISSTANIAGYISYQYASTMLGTLPLAGTNDEASEKLVGHIASDDTWWTGLVIRNTAGQGVNVTIRAFDADGNQIDSTTRSIAGNAKLAILARDLFPSTHAHITTMRLSATDLVAGLVLYGDLEMTYLA